MCIYLFCVSKKKRCIQRSEGSFSSLNPLKYRSIDHHRHHRHFQSISLSVCGILSAHFFLMFAHHFSSTDSIIHNLYLFYMVEAAKRCEWKNETDRRTRKKERKKRGKKCWSLFFELIFGCTCTISIVAFFGQFKRARNENQQQKRFSIHAPNCVCVLHLLPPAPLTRLHRRC